MSGVPCCSVISYSTIQRAQCHQSNIYCLSAGGEMITNAKLITYSDLTAWAELALTAYLKSDFSSTNKLGTKQNARSI